MLKDNLSYFANKLQGFLFPLMEDHLYQETLLEKHRKILAILEVLQIERFIPRSDPLSRGRPVKHRSQVTRAFIAKHVLNLKTTAELVYHLKIDKNLRYICGWLPGEKIANEATFSRVFEMLAKSNCLEEIHEALSKKVFKDHLVLHCGRDSVPVPAREWPNDQKRRRWFKKGNTIKKSYYKKITVSEKQQTQTLDEMIRELPQGCSIGKKTNSSGRVYCWRGYKLHMDVAEGWFPLSCILTSAHTHDTQPAIPLSLKTSKRAHVLYELMDKGYDSKVLATFITDVGRVGLITPRVWNGKRGEETKREILARANLRWKPAEEVRLKHRLADERLFSRIRDHFSGMSVWVRGHKKVQCHVMLAVLAMAADELLRFL